MHDYGAWCSILEPKSVYRGRRRTMRFNRDDKLFVTFGDLETEISKNTNFWLVWNIQFFLCYQVMFLI